MFESAIFSETSPARRTFALPSSIALHAAAVLAVLGASLWREEPLSEPPQPITLVTLAPAPPPAGSSSGTTHRGARVSAPSVAPREVLAAIPQARPQSAGGETDSRGSETPDAPSGLPDGVPGGSGDVPGAAPAEGSGDEPLLPGGDVRPPVLLERVAPDYPEVARKAGIQGIVILQAVIGTAGQVEELRLTKSVFAALDEAALRAVRRWRYRPATLNGRAVRVLLSVTAEFRLR
jgi:protein TonB